MIAAVMYVLNEADIIGDSITNLLEEGVERVYIALGPCTDDTLGAIATVGPELAGGKAINLFHDRSSIARQQHWTDKLSHRAFEEGASWILPVDADEFWGSTLDGVTIADALNNYTGSLDTICQADLYHHNTRELKVLPVERLPKVAYRASLSTQIGPGNHSVSGVVERGITLSGLLEVRHYQYRSFVHFSRKAQERNRTLSHESRMRGDGVHHTMLEGADDASLLARWHELQNRETVHDPIPFYSRHGLNP